jgi:flagellar hook-length control protein FliK
LPQQAASPLHAPEWTPPGSLSAAIDAGANAEPDANVPQSKTVQPAASAQIVTAHALLSQPPATPSLEANAPAKPMALGVMKAVDAVQSVPAQAPQDGAELPSSSAAASTMTAAAIAPFGAKLTRETSAPSQPPIEAPPATLIPGRSAEPLATRKAQPDAPRGRDAAFLAQKETPAPNAPNVGASTAAQAVAKEPAPPTFVTEPSAQVQLASASHAALAAVHEHAARAAPAAAQVAREIVRRFDGETTRFELRLDPPELGRVEVRLEVTRDHRVSAVVAADTPQALSELARHARDLEQTLQSAGLQLNENGLSFDLRQSDADTAEAGLLDAPGAGEARDDESPAQILARPIGLERWRGVRLDLVV